MDMQIESLVNDVRKLVPSVKKSELEQLVSQMSQRSGISPTTLLSILCEDLQNGIPFRHTAGGKISSMAL